MKTAINDNGDQLKFMNNEWVSMDAQPPIAQNDAGEQRMLIDNNWVEYKDGNAFDAKSNSWYPVGTGEVSAQDETSLPSGEDLINRMGGNDNPFTDMPDNDATRLMRDMALIGLGGGALQALSKVPALLPQIAQALNWTGKAISAPKSVVQATTGGGIVGGVDSGIAVADDDTLSTGEKVLEVAKGTGIGAATSGAAQGVLNKVLGKQLKEIVPDIKKLNARGQQLSETQQKALDAKFLEDRGIVLTDAQSRTGLPASIEAAAGNAAHTGEVARDLQSQATKSFNRQRAKDALRQIGKKVDDGTFAGADLNKQVKDKISQEYDRIKSTVNTTADGQLIRDSKAITGNQQTQSDFIADANNLPYEQQTNQLHKDIFDKNKVIDRDVNEQLQNALKRSAVRQNPEAFADVDIANSKLSTMLDASQDIANSHRVFSAENYLKAIQNKSTPAQFGTETAFDQEIAEAATNVMKQGIDPNGLPGLAHKNNMGSEVAGLMVKLRNAPVLKDAVDEITRLRDVGTPAAIFAGEGVHNFFSPESIQRRHSDVSNQDVYNLLMGKSLETRKTESKSNVQVRKMLTQ